jgi:nucleoside-diphosphate-sugar epimerase
MGRDNRKEDELKSRKVLVLGASGFIGGRLVEKLFFEYGHLAKCVARDYRNVARIARFPVEIIHGDVLKPEMIEKSVEDCDTYVFCVYGKEHDSKVNWEVNTKGLENMLRVGEKQGMKHFIFLSSGAIYEEQMHRGRIDESTVPVCSGMSYAHGKLEGERICREFSSRSGVPVTILRPTVVYGPFAPSWTVYPAELVRNGVLKQYISFSGYCNAVYIDDVVNTIIKSILNPDAFGEEFIVSSGELITWKSFFDAFSLAAVGTPLEEASRIEYYLKSIPLFWLKKVVKYGAQLLPDPAKKVYAYIKSKGSGDWSWVKGQDITTLDLAYYKKRLEFKIDKLKTKLHYEPQFDFERGFAITREWLKYQGYF